MKRRTNRVFGTQAGFSLVEALIALLVLSIGMLGIAGLYVEGLKAGRTAITRTQAVTLAGDMADRISANPTALAGYTAVGPGAGVNNNCAGVAPANCTPPQMASNDIFLWQQAVANVLPNGLGTIGFAAGAAGVPDTYTITVAWAEQGQGNVNYVLTVER